MDKTTIKVPKWDNTKEMSVLLDGVISEMKEMGLPLPLTRDVQNALKQWELEHDSKK